MHGRSGFSASCNLESGTKEEFVKFLLAILLTFSIYKLFQKNYDMVLSSIA
jgi:hypothetical protein